MGDQSRHSSGLAQQIVCTGFFGEACRCGNAGRIEELAKASGDAEIDISAQDAWKLKIAPGDTVEITSRYGVLQGKARLTSSPRQGVVFTTFHDAKLLINRVVADHVDPVSKEPEYKVTAVSLTKVVG